MDIPIIDIDRIDNQERQLAISKQIAAASRAWGFFLLKNHHIAVEDIDHLFHLSREFFVDLPDEEKIPWPVNNKYVGYNHPLSDLKKDDKASMWLSGKPGQLAQLCDALPPFWRANIDKIEEFKHACHSLIIKLLVCFAVAMDLPDRNFFAKAHAEDAGDGNRFRMICYPAREEDLSKTTTRMSPHSDSGSITLLFQTCSGLEVESPSGEWVLAPHLPGHILVNFGDALAFWSNGRLRATRHRVTFQGVPSNTERLSMAYFGGAAPDTVLEPIKTTNDETVMEKYEANDLVLRPGITVGEYSDMIMKNIYGAGVTQQMPQGPVEHIKSAA